MSARQTLVSCAVITGVLCMVAARVDAQAQALSPPPPPAGSASGAPSATADDGVDALDVGRLPDCIVVPKKKEPMSSWAIGVSIGFSHVGAGDVRNPAYSPALADLASMVSEQQLIDAGLRGEGCTPLDKRCSTDSRSGFQLAFPLQLGGSGVGFRFEPFFAVTSHAKAYGAYMGPTFEARVAERLYLGFGFGLKSAWVKPSGWLYAVDLHGRIPVHATLYATDNVAFVLEAAFGAGASAFRNRPTPIRNPLTGKRLQSIPNVTFGLARTWDLSIGVRFP